MDLIIGRIATVSYMQNENTLESYQKTCDVNVVDCDN